MMDAIEWLKAKALFGCKCQECAEEQSMNFSEFRLSPVDQKPICEACYDEEERPDTVDENGDVTNWDELPAFDPFAGLSVGKTA